MGQAWRGAWGPWTRHDGSCMPVPKGTIVEAFSNQDPARAKDGVVQRIGIAGIDLVRSWYWTKDTRSTQRSLPIDWYRVMRPGAESAAPARGRSTRVPEHA